MVFVIVALAAFAAGFINAVAGGGSFLTFPALIAAGLPPIDANASNTVALFPGQIATGYAARDGLVAASADSRINVPVLAAISLVGGFLGGILLLVTEVGERVVKNGKWNARLRCIFENGTESDMLLRSLASELYKDGRRVTLLDDKLMNEMLVTDDDKATGYIYVLRSLSQHPDIKAIPNLYKIGLARQSIETRIQNAANEPTYLMAAVALVSTFQCYNVNLPKLENLLHRFFDPAAAKIQVTDAQGNYHTPKEWFSIPLATIETAVRLLISGEIVNYTYNPSTGQILLNP